MVLMLKSKETEKLKKQAFTGTENRQYWIQSTWEKMTDYLTDYGKLTIACSILLSMAATLVPEVL